MSDQQQIVDADVIDGQPEPEPVRALVVPQPGATLAVTPQVEAKELVERLNVIRDAAENAMQEGVDYGKVPGTDKPTLLKPGAEKLGVLFQLNVQLQNKKFWDGDHLTVESTAVVYHAPTGTQLGFGEGMCSTREKKYAKRQAQRTCPACGETTIFKSKHPPRDRPQDPPGWFCWSKKGGCGANFPADDERITSQDAGPVDNPDLPDAWNTVVKMAEKRARVDAVLAVTGASAIFTQDIEDAAPPSGPPPEEPPAAAAEPTETIDPKWACELEDKVRATNLTLGQVRDLLAPIYGSRTAEWTPEQIARGIACLSPANAKALEEELEK